MRPARGALAAAALALACPARRPASLGEPVSIEQPGGTVSQLFARGSELPANATESFSNARDGDTRLVVHVVRGAGKEVGKLQTDGYWEIEGVRPAKAGTARVMLTFELDAQGQLSVFAREGDRRLDVAKRSDAPGSGGSLAPLTEPDDPDDDEPE